MSGDGDLAALVRAVRFTATSCTWLGVPLARAGAAARQDPSALTAALAARVYSDFYQCGGVRPAGAERPPAEPDTAAATADALDAVTAGRRSWHAGWTIAAVSAGAAVLERDGLQVGAPPGAWEPLAQPAPGQPARLALPAGRSLLGTGAYFVEGREALWDPPALLRLYCNVLPGAVPALVDLLAVDLDRRGVPFQLKAFCDPAETERRADSVVLYAPARAWADVVPAARTVLDARPGLLGAAVPAFTRRLAPGLGLAEDPGDGPSFGMLRSRQAAEALVAAHASGARGPAEVLRHARQAWQEAGIDPDRPWLVHGSAADYPWGPADAPEATLPGRRQPPPGAGVASADPLDVAVTLGLRALDAAQSDGERRTWVGWVPSGAGHGRYETLGPDLYGGTSGVAVLCAELATATGDERFAAAATAAARQALATADRLRAGWLHGFFTGLPGVAWAVGLVADRLADASLRAGADDLVDQLRRAPATDQVDLVAGWAGTLAWAARRPAASDLAATAARELMARAERVGAGLAWSRPGDRSAVRLTGMAHGASGIAHAFLASGGAGVADGGATARAAFAYERRWFDEAAGNWADLRDVPVALRRRRGLALRRPLAWCYGAPGMLLARLGADCDAAAAREVDAARGAVEAAAERWLREPGRDLSLCHGAGALLGALLASPPDGHADRLAGALAARAAAPSQPGPADTPGLMLGYGGVGLALLDAARGGATCVTLLAAGTACRQAAAGEVEASR